MNETSKLCGRGRPVIRAAALILTVLALTPAHPSSAQPDEWRTAKSAIVMISGHLNGVETAGAGIIVGYVAETDRLYVLTADHVVREQGETAQKVKVRFSFLPGEDFEARVLADRNSALDLAVLAIPDIAKKGVPVHAVPEEILGRTDLLTRGTPLFPLGHPHGRKWWLPVDPARFDQPDGSSLQFETSLGILPGQSGGGLFDGCHNLIGVVLRSNPPWGEAVDIGVALQWLRNTGYPIDLRLSPRCERTPRPPLLGASKDLVFQDVDLHQPDGKILRCSTFSLFAGGWLCTQSSSR